MWEAINGQTFERPWIPSISCLGCMLWLENAPRDAGSCGGDERQRDQMQTAEDVENGLRPLGLPTLLQEHE